MFICIHIIYHSLYFIFALHMSLLLSKDQTINNNNQEHLHHINEIKTQKFKIVYNRDPQIKNK